MNNKLEELFLNIITRGRKDNTYKFAFAKFLLDKSKSQEDIVNVKISYNEIAESFLKYYWIQECKYKLKQDFKVDKQPVIITIIQKHCELDYISTSYEKYFKDKNEKKQKIINEIEKKCLFDVIPRFQPSNNNIFYKHYHLLSNNGKKFNVPCLKERHIILYKDTIIFFKIYYELLHKSLILEWAKFLEKTNFIPKLISKIENLGNTKRESLLKYKKMLLEIDNKCFYCNCVL